MSFTSYDRKSYRESKRRRRQAMRQNETGIIKPFRRRNKPLFIGVAAAVLLCAVAALVFFHPFAPAQKEAQDPRFSLSDEERLQLVNRASPMKETDVPPLAEFQSVKVHAVIAGNLEAMTAAAKKKGITLSVTDGYVSFSEQQKRYEKELAQFEGKKEYTPVRAQAAAQAIVPKAGCSEAQTGLYVEFDVSDPHVKAFVERECIHFGFIQRYAENKEDQTHMRYNESGYRFVGKEDAEKMRAFDMCLEEYDDYLSSQSINTVL